MAIQQGQAHLREKARYEVTQAVAEIDKAIAFGYERANPMSVAKLLELKCKLYGLLVEKIDLKASVVDLKGALEEARLRVINAPAAPHRFNLFEETR